MLSLKVWINGLIKAILGLCLYHFACFKNFKQKVEIIKFYYCYFKCYPLTSVQFS